MPVAPPYSIMINKNVSRYWQMSLEGKIAPSWEPLDITLEKDNWFYVPWDSSTNSNGAQAVVFHKSLTRPILPRFSAEGSHRTNREGSLDGWFFCVFPRKSVQHLVRKYVSTDCIQCIMAENARFHGFISPVVRSVPGKQLREKPALPKVTPVPRSSLNPIIVGL